MASVGSMKMCSRILRGLCGFNGAVIKKSVHRRCCLRLLTTVDSNSPKAETASANETAPPVVPDGDVFAEERTKLMADIEDLQDKYRRALAETENVRARMRRQLDETRQFGVQALVKDLLEVADVLTQATDSVPAETLAAGDAHLRSMHSGLTMTRTQLLKIFERHGVLEIAPAVGEKFDPHVHEALFQQTASGDQLADTVAVLTKVGYKLHARTVRPAIVGVFKSAS